MSGGGGGGGPRRRKVKLTPFDDHLDLVPLIDCVFLLLLFFMLCGRLTLDQRTEQITVPPTKLARKLDADNEKTRVLINVFGNTRLTGGTTEKAVPRNTISMVPRAGAPPEKWHQTGGEGPNAFSGYKALRKRLDDIYDRANKKPDPKNSSLQLPQVIVEIRADCDTEYRVVQEIMMILTDSVMIDEKEGIKARPVTGGVMRPFVEIDYTTRPTTGR